MSFTGQENHSITLEEASKLTANYRKNAGLNALKAGFVGKDAIKSIIEQEGCVGIRIYNAEKEDGKRDFVLVGADANEKDITGGIIAEKIFPCPPYCDLYVLPPIL